MTDIIAEINSAAVCWTTTCFTVKPLRHRNVIHVESAWIKIVV
jgi:hypothetical protein